MMMILMLMILLIPIQDEKEIQLTAADGMIIYGIENKQDSEVTILLFHQAGSNAKAEYGGHIIQKLLEEGYSTIAIDQRKGGSRLGGTNRTAEQVEGSISYCDAYPDLVATLEYATNKGQKIVVWGSSYSAALVYKLAAEHGEDISGVLSFSPASGAPMGNCSPDKFLKDLKAPSLAFRPGKEASMETVKSQIEYFKSMDVKTYVSPLGVHGSSMLNPEKSGGVEETWIAVLDFLRSI